MNIKMLFDYRILFTKGAEVDVEEGEAVRLLSLGVAEKAEEKKVVEEVKAEEKKAVGRPKKKKED